jgi:inner membrane protein
LDSVTQIALGAAVGEAVLGSKVGNRAIMWGALCGTLPDLDVFVPFAGPVEAFTYHRSFSHSILVALLATPLIAWLILKLHPDTAPQRRGWLLLVYLALATHALLDAFTVYGTQILWPLDPTPVTWSTVFIIDPAYTLPLLIGVTCALVAKRQSSWGHRANMAGLVLSSLYLAWSVAVKLHVDSVARDALAQQGIGYTKLLSGPGPFNTLLWRVLVMDEGGYYEGLYSLLDRERTIRFARYPSRPQLLRGLEEHWAVRRLQWFTKGFYSVGLEGNAVVISDLRMGLEPGYVFRFKVGEIGNPHARPLPAEQLPARRQIERLPWVWERIWSPDAVWPR